jgi:hypothetical protein
MTQPQPTRPRIFWYELAEKWAVRAPPLENAHRARLFTTALRQACGAVFHHGLQAWVIPDSALEAAKQLVTQYYRHFEFVERPKPKTAPPPPPAPTPIDAAYETFCALVGWKGPARLSFARARALYRRAATRLHPDVGGPADQMASLNAAWRAIKDTLT